MELSESNRKKTVFIFKICDFCKQQANSKYLFKHFLDAEPLAAWLQKATLGVPSRTAAPQRIPAANEALLFQASRAGWWLCELAEIPRDH